MGFEKEKQWHEELDRFEQLNLYKKNIGLLIDDMKFYFDIQKQTEKMKALFLEDEMNYEYIHHKLLTQTELRDNLIDKMR